MAEMMKAQVFYKAERMNLEEIPVPEVTDIDVLVRVKNCGICGSDISYYYGLSPVDTPTGKGPLVLGHEFTGDVVEVGAIPRSLGLFEPGDRVVVNPVQNCNACYARPDGRTCAQACSCQACRRTAALPSIVSRAILVSSSCRMRSATPPVPSQSLWHALFMASRSWISNQGSSWLCLGRDLSA